MHQNPPISGKKKFWGGGTAPPDHPLDPPPPIGSATAAEGLEGQIK